MTTDGHTDTKCEQKFKELFIDMAVAQEKIKAYESGIAEIKKILNDNLDGFKEWKKDVSLHVADGEKVGGTRDRIKDLEMIVAHKKIRIDKIEKNILCNSILGGVIGGLIALATPETFNLVFKLVGFIK